MKAHRDYACWDCEEFEFDYFGEYKEVPYCPKCHRPMEFIPTKVNVDTYFPGSHNSEYTHHGNKFQNGTSKQKLLDDLKQAKKK